MPTDAQAGDKIGSFRLVQKLGEGGMGVVFKAEDESLGRFVAVKILSRGLATDQEFTQRFLREAKSVALLNHPNIIQVHFVGQQGEQYYMAMEYVDGCSFGALVGQRGPLPESEALEAIRQAALGLRHALKQGIIHRDIKPDNLLLTSEGEVKIADFGLAKRVTGEESIALTTTMTVVGTPSYMSPEQALGEPLDHRTDIYSLGCTLYYLLTIHTPCEASTVMKVLMKQIQEPPVPIEQHRPETSPAVRRILQRMLTKDRKDRYETYEELIADLELAHAAPFQLTPSGRQVTPQGLRRGRSSFWTVRRAIIAAEVVVILFLAISLGLWYFKPTKSPAIVPPVKPPPKTSPTAFTTTNPVTPTVTPAPTNIKPTPTPTIPAPLPTVLTTTPTDLIEDPVRWASAINLLPLINVQRDGVEGKVRREGDDLVLSDGAPSKVEVPYRCPAEYDVRMTFYFEGTPSWAALHLVQGNARFLWTIGKDVCGFEDVGGNGLGQNPSASAHLREPLQAGRLYQTLVEVRKDGLRAYLNGKEVVHYQTDGHELTRNKNWELKDPTLLGFGTWSGSLRVGALQVREVTGKGTFVRGANPAPVAAETQRHAINLLALIDPQKDAVAGKWELKQGALWSDDTYQARLEIPYQPPAEYDFRIKYTPKSGTGVILQLLRHSDKTFGWVMEKKFFGFELVQGKSAADNPTMANGTVEFGRPYVSVVQVRNSGLKAYVNGQLVCLWPTDYRDFTAHVGWKLNNTALLGLAHWGTVTQFQSVEVVEITGQGVFARPNDPAAKTEEARRIQASKTASLPSVAPNPSKPASPNLTPWVALNLSALYKADVIATEAYSSGEPFSPPDGQLPTTSWLKKNAPQLRVAGFPDNGQLEIPKSNPRGFFEIPIGSPNALFLSSAKGTYPTPVTIDLSPEQSAKYSQLEFLDAGIAGGGEVKLTLHYTTGADDQKILQILDQIAPPRPAQKAGDPLLALTTRGTNNLAVARNSQLYVQVVSTNSQRVLKGMTLTFKSYLPPGGPLPGSGSPQGQPSRPARPQGGAGGGEASEEHFTAVIFAISALRADK